MGTNDTDLTDLDAFAAGPPHEIFARLRRECPVYWNAERGGGGFWAVTAYSDVVAVSRDSETFSSERGGIMIADSPLVGADEQMMITMDPPRHNRYRALVNRGFTPRMVRRLDGFMRERVNDILDRALAKSGCDFVEDVAAELPLQVIVELLGVPQEDRREIFELANGVIGFDDPEFGGDGGAPLEALTRMYAYAQQLAAEKRANPQDDIVSALLSADVDGEQLTEQEFNLFFVLLAVAGSETTRSAIAGGALAFDEHPEQWERLRKDRRLLPTAVEEILRWTTPLQHFRRTATRAAEVGGQAVRAGDKVVLWYVSANRDEAVFEQPFRFDVGRSPNEHLAFGHGRHFCLGANLARRELAIMFEALLEREVEIERLGPPVWMRSNLASSIKRMPVRLSAPGFRTAG